MISITEDEYSVKCVKCDKLLKVKIRNNIFAVSSSRCFGHHHNIVYIRSFRPIYRFLDKRPIILSHIWWLIKYHQQKCYDHVILYPHTFLVMDFQVRSPFTSQVIFGIDSYTTSFVSSNMSIWFQLICYLKVDFIIQPLFVERLNLILKNFNFGL